MFDWKRKLVAGVIGCFLAGGAFAQKKDEPRPPKQPNEVVVAPKGERPPPNNNNNQGDKNKDGKKGKN